MPKRKYPVWECPQCIFVCIATMSKDIEEHIQSHKDGDAND